MKEETWFFMKFHERSYRPSHRPNYLKLPQWRSTKDPVRVLEWWGTYRNELGLFRVQGHCWESSGCMKAQGFLIKEKKKVAACNSTIALPEWSDRSSVCSLRHMPSIMFKGTLEVCSGNWYYLVNFSLFGNKLHERD